MELRQLTYFVTLAEHLHFGKAAEALDLSPSALSMQLQSLEKTLGVRLVHRTKRSVSLTSAGVIFLGEARATLAKAAQAALAAQRAGRGEIGSLRVGYVISAACAGIVQRLLGTYHSAFPEMTVWLSEVESPEQIRLLSEGTLDACIVRTVTASPEAFDTIQLACERLAIALPMKHALARKPRLIARDLMQQPFIVPQFQREIGFARHVLAIGSRAGFTPEVAVQTRDFLTALTLVGAGFGVAAVPRSIQMLKLPNVVYRDLDDVAEESALSIVFRRADPSPPVVRLRKIAHTLAAKS
jgi:DNA-binding transcriptional LysR family regulator